MMKTIGKVLTGASAVFKFNGKKVAYAAVDYAHVWNIERNFLKFLAKTGNKAARKSLAEFEYMRPIETVKPEPYKK